MGNACTITTCPRALSSQSSSLFTSLSIPVNSELSEYHGSQGRSSSLSLINQAHIPNSLTTFVTLNANKGYKKPVYALDSRNIQKIIEKQQQADYSLSESEGEDNNQPVSLPRLEDGDDCDANVQSKNWLASKEEENTDIMRRFNLLEGRAKSNEPVNLPIRRTIEEKTTTSGLYNRDRIEYNDEIKAREERERRIAAGLSKIFGDSSCPIEKIRSNSAMKQRLFPKEDEHKITIKDDSLKREDPSLSDCSPFNGSSTGVLCTEGDDGSLSGRYINIKSRGVKKSVVESVLARRNICVRKNEDKKENNKSKSLINYCPEEVVEKTIVAELYEGVSQPQSSPSEQAVEIAAPVAKIEVKDDPKTVTTVQEKPKEVPVARQLLSERKCDYNTNGTIKALSSVEKKYTSNQGWLSSRKGTENSLHLTGSPTSEFMLFNRELKWDKQLRNESIAERLMESMLEERADEKDTFNLVLASGEKCPLPIIRRNLFDSEKKSYRGDSNRKERPDSQIRGHESVGSVTKEDGYKTNRQKENDQRMLYETPKKNEKYMIVGNNKENVQQSPSPAKGFVSVTELDAKEDIETGAEPVTTVKEPVIEGVMVEEKKAILDEVENLQKEVFEKMSQVTSDLKKGTLAPEKITELKEIQDKLQKLTRLSSLMHTGDPQNIKPPEKNHNTPINQNKLNVETIMEDEARHKFNTQSHKEVITISSDNICSPVHTDGSFSMKPYDTKPEPTPTKMFDVDISAIVKRKRDRVVTEGDSIIMKPSLMPVESRATLEFFETEMECQQLLMRQNDLKSFKNLLELDQSGISHRTATSYTKDRRTPGARGQHSAESRKNGSNQLYKQVVETTNPVMFQHMIRKLSYPKNLSTYNEPELNSYRDNLKTRASVNNYKEKNTRGSVTERLTQTSSTVRPCKMKQQQQQPELLARRQSANPVAKKAVERRSSGPTTTMCSRKTSAEKVRPITSTITATEIKTSNTSRDMSRERVLQGRMSVGTCEVSRSGVRDTPNKGSCSSKRTSVDKCMSSERKKKAGPAVVQYRRESTEPCPEGDLFDTAYDTNKVGALREEITKLNQKLDVKRNSGKMVTEPAVEEEDVYAQRMKMHKIGIDRGQKEGAYTARARKRMEYFNPTTFRAEHTGLNDRRPTAVNMEDQPEQNGDYIMTEPSYVDKSVLMRTKLIEEIAKRQSLMEDSEWVLNMKIPVMPVPGMRGQMRGGLGFK